MKSILLISTALTLGLAACGQQQTGKAERQADTATGAARIDMAAPPMAAGTEKIGKGTGTITAVDSATGKITIDHAAIPDVDWPAMTMGFTAAPAVIATAKVGDRADFDLRVRGNGAEVTAIRPR